MEFKNTDRVLICQRTSDFTPPVASHIDTCVLCLAPVYRSLRSPQVDHVVCVQCGIEQIAQYPGAKVEGPTPEQLDEIRRYFAAL